MPSIHGERAELISAPREQCVAALLGVERYPDWYDTLDEARVTARDADGRPREVGIGAEAGPLGVLRLELAFSYALPERITATQTGGDGRIRDFASTWQLDAVGPSTTRVSYRLQADAGNLRTRAALRVAAPLVRRGLIDAFPQALKRLLENGEAG